MVAIQPWIVNDPLWAAHEHNIIMEGNIQRDTTAIESIVERLEDVSTMPCFCLSIDADLHAAYSTKHSIHALGDAQHSGDTTG